MTNAVVELFADWETGAAESPVANDDEESSFPVAAVAIYCLQFYDELESISPGP